MEKEPKLLVVQDQRGEHRYLRASWHAETRSIVLSHWCDDVCTASTRLALADAPRLIGFLVDTLHNAAATPLPSSAPGPGRPGTPRPDGLATQVQTWIRRLLAPPAPVIPLSEHRTAPVPGRPERPPRENAN